jgi:PKD repeat protein
MLLDAVVDHQWSQLNYDSFTTAEAIATVDTLAPLELDENKVNRIRVPVTLLEARRASTDRVTFRIDGPTFLWRNIWEWYGWWSGNEPATTDRGPRLIVEYGAIEPVEFVPPPQENRPPAPEIIAETGRGEPGIAYDFTFSAVDPEAEVLGLTIDWGDGRVERFGDVPSGASVTRSHAWEAEGIYVVSLEAIDEAGASGTVGVVIEIESSAPPPPPQENHPPVITVLSGPDGGFVDVEYGFDVSATDQDGDEVRFIVDWGDGTGDETGFYPQTTTVSLFHGWGEPGNYTVVLTAEDSEGASASSSRTIEIQASVGAELVVSDTPVGTWYLGSSSGRIRQAQTFRAIGSRITAVSLALVRVGDPPGPIQVTVRRQSPTGAVLASAQVDPSEIASRDVDNPSWVTVYFTAPPEVNEGSSYYLVLEASPPDTTDYYRVGYSTDTYPDGWWYLGTTARRDLDMVCTVAFDR